MFLENHSQSHLVKNLKSVTIIGGIRDEITLHEMHFHRFIIYIQTCLHSSHSYTWYAVRNNACQTDMCRVEDSPLYEAQRAEF